ncbi:MAG: DUF3108 domain-containing protein [Pseudomonadota bacterium]
MSRRLTLTVLSLLPMLAMAPAANADQTTVKAKYRINLLGLNVGTLRMTTAIDGTTYTIDGSGNISGLPQLFIEFKGKTSSRGTFRDNAPRPARHSIGYNTVKKDYSTEMSWRGGSVTGLDLVPPYKVKRSRVPIEAAHKVGVIDPVSAVLAPVTSGAFDGAAACNRSLPIFDGRERFNVDLSFKRIGKVKGETDKDYSGAVVVCGAKYSPIAGHRREGDDWIKALKRTEKIEIWLAPLHDAKTFVLYRARIPTPWGPAVIYPRRFRIATPSSSS